jgi:hypothetical protein
MQTGYPHSPEYTYFSNDLQALNRLVVFKVLVARPRKLAERGNGVSGDDGARREVPTDPASHLIKDSDVLLDSRH